MLPDQIYKLLKYVGVFAAVYLMLRYVPRECFSQKESSLFAIVIVLLFVLFEYLNVYGGGAFMTNTEKSAMCSNVCNTMKTEHMDNTTQQAGAASTAEIVAAVQQVLAGQSAPPVKSDDDSMFTAPPVINTSATIPATVKMSQPPQGVNNNERPAETGMVYDETTYNDYHHIPMSDNNMGNFEYGYSFMPPEKWYPQPPFPPTCVTKNRCPVCPTFTTGTPIDVKEWHSSRVADQPIQINEKYVHEVLNK